VEKALKDVEIFTSNLSAVDYVENLKEYERVINVSQFFSLVFSGGKRL
jgi:hypothetical protein